jgi:hypothetical protein
MTTDAGSRFLDRLITDPQLRGAIVSLWRNRQEREIGEGQA